MALGDVWHKTLVYFGIAEEDDFHDEETLAPHEELEQSYRERPNVKRVERETRSSIRRRAASTDFDDVYAQDDAFRNQRTSVIRPVPTPAEAPSVKVHLVVPKNFNDAQLIADKYKADVPVILNLQGSETDLSKRLIDFASGLTYALDGGMQRVADKVFLLTPKNVEVSAEERQRLMEKGFFNQF
ncbi:MAG: cell division protein SepF [Thermoleophilia bacterium]